MKEGSWMVGEIVCLSDESPHAWVTKLGFAGAGKLRGVAGAEHAAVMYGPDPTGTDVIFHQLIGKAMTCF